MLILETLAVAFGMFSALPCPQPAWNERNMRFALCAFPLVGAVLGLFWWGWMWLCEALAVPVLLRAAGLCLLPVLVTGGIHLDGYADTCDALASRAAPARCREILRDPHCGAFAVIRLCTYFVASFALCAALIPGWRAAFCAALGFCLTRALSGLSVASFPIADGSSLARTFAGAADRRIVRIVLALTAALCAAGLCGFGGLAGTAMVLAAAGAFWRYAHVTSRRFEGLSGDLAGWFLQTAELWMLAAFVAVQIAEERL